MTKKTVSHCQRHATQLTRGFLLICLATAVGCGHYLVPERFQPLDADDQQAPDGTKLDVLDDGTVTFARGRLEVSVRPMQDEELNRQFPRLSKSTSPSDPLPSNPFTFGDWEDPRTGRPPQRFSIFLVTVKNYEFPKVKLDPMKIVIQSTNGREYFPWGSYDFEELFRRYALAFNGQGYQRYSERKELIQRTAYPDDEFCFSGQEVQGYVIFPKIHDDVDEITLHIIDLVNRYDYRGGPLESIDISYRFNRELRKVWSARELANR